MRHYHECAVHLQAPTQLRDTARHRDPHMHLLPPAPPPFVSMPRAGPHRPCNQAEGCHTCPLPLQQRSGLSHTCTDLATSFRAAKHAHCPSHRTTICTATHHSRNLQRTPQDKARGNATFSRRRHSSWLPHAALITSSDHAYRHQSPAQHQDRLPLCFQLRASTRAASPSRPPHQPG